MEHIKITILGKPIAKNRPRFYRRGKYVGTYNDQETEEGRFMLQAQQQWGKRLPVEGAVSLKCWFVFNFPKSMSKKKRGEAMHTKRPDLDNCVKFVKDCLNGIVWKDDALVVSLMAKKLYDYEGKGARTEIIIATPGIVEGMPI